MGSASEDGSCSEGGAEVRLRTAEQQLRRTGGKMRTGEDTTHRAA